VFSNLILCFGLLNINQTTMAMITQQGHMINEDMVAFLTAFMLIANMLIGSNQNTMYDVFWQTTAMKSSQSLVGRFLHMTPLHLTQSNAHSRQTQFNKVRRKLVPIFSYSINFKTSTR